MADASTIHASAVLTGPKAVLIRGPSGSGKSLLAWNLVNAASQGLLPFGRLVGDDRLMIDSRADRILVRPADALAGLIEIYGLGIRRLSFEPVAAVGIVVDLAAADAARHPGVTAASTALAGVVLPRLAIASGIDPLPMVLAALRTAPAGN
ncbi:MAG TPA: serine kinase [Pseudolabrys sp.]|nr:serine kinase [Pseudolabrys sp.]